jgi:hypothetical protein
MSMNELPDAKSLIINPFPAVVFAPYLFKERELVCAKEDWVLLNAKVIEDNSPKLWLDEFLDAISMSRMKYDGHDVINPSLAIRISDDLQGDHQPIITRPLWIAANEKLMNELGVAEWLWQLLNVLETGPSA